METTVPHKIYKITNMVNGKVYVGLTKKDLSERLLWHFKDAKNNPNKASYNRHLMRAIRKYGEENFYIEQIDFAKDRDEAGLKEMYWIKTLCSKGKSGYNMTDGGEGVRGYEMSEERRKQISEQNSGENNYWYGKFCNNSPHYGKNLSETHKELLKRNNANNKSITIEGVTYRSLKAAVEHFQVGRESVKRLENWEAELSKIQVYRVVFDGVLYYGIKEAARQLGTTKYKLERRILSGEGEYYNEPWTFEEFVEYLRTLQTSMKAVEYKGEVFRSIKKLSEKYGFNNDVVRRLMREGIVKEVDEKFYREAHNSKPVRFEGVEYVSKSKFMEEFKISGKEFKRLVSEGYVEVLA